MNELALLEFLECEILVPGSVVTFYRKELTDHVKRRVLKSLFLKAHATSPFCKERPIGLGFTDWFDDLFTNLNVPALIITDYVIRFKLCGSRKDQIAILQCIGHDHVKTNTEEVF